MVEEEGILDVGYGIRPDHMGRGQDGGFVRAILDFAVRGFSPRRLRLLILDWNDRSRKVGEEGTRAADGQGAARGAEDHVELSSRDLSVEQLLEMGRSLVPLPPGPQT